MDASIRIAALVAYVPVIGWLYVPLFERRNGFAMFHVKQSIGLFVFLAAVFAGWAVVTWITAWIPFVFLFGVALFTMVIAAGIFGVVAWIMGIVNALRGRTAALPLFGRMADRM